MDPWGVVHDSPGTASRHTPCRKMVCTLHTIMRAAGCARVGREYARAHAWPRPWRPCGIYIGVGKGGRAPMTGGAACCYSNCSRISSAMFLGEDWKIGCRREEGVDFLKIVVYRIMIGWSSFRVDWMIYTTLNLKNCIDILQSLFSKRNLLINNGETTLNF